MAEFSESSSEAFPNANNDRDRKLSRLLRTRGWRVIRVWEHEFKRRDESKLVRRLRRLLAR